MRTVKPWVGKTDDTKVPPHVRLRVFEKHGGVCYLSKKKIYPGDKWELEHIIALCNGGRHAEENLAPALVAPHKIKTKADRAEKKRNDKIRKAHIGIRKPSRFPGSRDSPFKIRLTSRGREVVRR